MTLPLIRIVDDDPSVCQSMSFRLRIEGYEVKSYMKATDFLNEDDTSRHGCIILDVRMPEMSGLELFQELKTRQIRLPVIFLTGHGDIAMAVQALHDGARDFLVKPVLPDKLIETVKEALEAALEAMRQDKEHQEVCALVQTLTKSELSVAQLIAKGLPTNTIASVLEMTENTVKSYRLSIYRKLDVLNPVEIAEVIREFNRGGRRD